MVPSSRYSLGYMGSSIASFFCIEGDRPPCEAINSIEGDGADGADGAPVWGSVMVAVE